MIRIMHLQHSPSEVAELQPAGLWLQVLCKAKHLSTSCTLAALAACSFVSHQVHGLQQTHQQLQQPTWTIIKPAWGAIFVQPCSYQRHDPQQTYQKLPQPT